MTNNSPQVHLDARYSGENVPATPWPDVVARLEQAELFWVTTIRPDGRLHITPVVAVWLEGALYFSSGPEEQKSRNLAANPQCAATTGCNSWDQGFDIVLHGEAAVVRDLALLRRIAGTFVAKYGQAWAFEVGDDGTFRHRGVALVYRLAPAQALGFGKGPFSHTRYDFSSAPGPAGSR
ncbi:MAG TPA: pyridoxamine 5'-phosphate oxidase family protein [Streptosporangiaceae bacterium]